MEWKRISRRMTAMLHSWLETDDMPRKILGLFKDHKSVPKIRILLYQVYKNEKNS